MVNWSMPDYLGICSAYLFFSFLSALCISETKTVRLDFVLERRIQWRLGTAHWDKLRGDDPAVWCESEISPVTKRAIHHGHTPKCVRRKEAYHSRCSIKINESVCSPLNLQCLAWYGCQSIFAEWMSKWSRMLRSFGYQ